MKDEEQPRSGSSLSGRKLLLFAVTYIGGFAALWMLAASALESLGAILWPPTALPTTAAPQDALQVAFDFSKSELEVNREGRASLLQLRYYHFATIVACFAAMVGTCFAGVQTLAKWVPQGRWLQSLGLLLVGAVFYSAGVGCLVIGWPVAQDFVYHDACFTVGYVTYGPKRSGKNYVVGIVNIGELALRTVWRKHAGEALVPGTTYRVHYSCHGREFLSMEPVAFESTSGDLNTSPKLGP